MSLQLIVNDIEYPAPSYVDTYSIAAENSEEEYETESGGIQEIVRSFSRVVIEYALPCSKDFLDTIHAHAKTRPLSVKCNYPDVTELTERIMKMVISSEELINFSDKAVEGGVWNVKLTFTAYEPDN